jgi:hypothetical protein
LLEWVEAQRRHGREVESEAALLRELARETMQAHKKIATDQAVNQRTDSWVKALSRHRKTLADANATQPTQRGIAGERA